MSADSLLYQLETVKMQLVVLNLIEQGIRNIIEAKRKQVQQRYDQLKGQYEQEAPE